MLLLRESSKDQLHHNGSKKPSRTGLPAQTKMHVVRTRTHESRSQSFLLDEAESAKHVGIFDHFRIPRYWTRGHTDECPWEGAANQIEPDLLYNLVQRMPHQRRQGRLLLLMIRISLTRRMACEANERDLIITHSSHTYQDGCLVRQPPLEGGCAGE